MLLGGEFTAVNGVGQQGLVRFARPGPKAPGRQGPVDRSAATAPTVTAGSDGTASVSWLSNWDRDQLSLSYDVLRNGAVIRTVTGTQTFWKRPTRRITDSGLRPGTTYRYQIRARDNTNSVLSPETVFTYPSAALRKSAAPEPEDASVELWLRTRATDRPVAAYGSTSATEVGHAEPRAPRRRGREAGFHRPAGRRDRIPAADGADRRVGRRRSLAPRGGRAHRQRGRAVPGREAGRHQLHVAARGRAGTVVGLRRGAVGPRGEGPDERRVLRPRPPADPDRGQAALPGEGSVGPAGSERPTTLARVTTETETRTADPSGQ